MSSEKQLMLVLRKWFLCFWGFSQPGSVPKDVEFTDMYSKRSKSLPVDQKKINKTAKNHPRMLIYDAYHPGTSLFLAPLAICA
jgi:hypothetical protein